MSKWWSLKTYIECCGTELVSTYAGSIIELCVFFYLFQSNTMTAVPLLWVCRLLWPAAPSAVNSVEQITLMPHNHSYITHTLILCFDFRFSSLNSQTALLSNQTMQHCRENIAFSFHQPSVTNKMFYHVCLVYDCISFHMHRIANCPYQS